MENKYYTPQIAELYIGYKCEVKESNGWYPWDTYNAGDVSDLTDWIRTGDVRTKYLDKEDIESLGWLHVGGQMISFGTQDFELRSGDIVYLLKYIPRAVIKNEVRRETAIMLQMTVDNPEQIPGGDEAAMKYYGACPSINELKFLMKLLNIEYNGNHSKM